MFELVRLTAKVDGGVLLVRWDVPAEAHPLGLSPAHDTRSVRLVDDLGTPDGVVLVRDYMVEAVHRAMDELYGAWDAEPLFRA